MIAHERFNKYFFQLLEISAKVYWNDREIIKSLMHDIYTDAINEEKMVKIQIEKDWEVKSFLSYQECGDFLGSSRTMVARAVKKSYNIKWWKILWN